MIAHELTFRIDRLSPKAVVPQPYSYYEWSLRKCHRPKRQEFGTPLCQAGPSLQAEDFQELIDLQAQNKTVQEIAAETGFAPTTAHRNFLVCSVQQWSGTGGTKSFQLNVIINEVQ